MSATTPNINAITRLEASFSRKFLCSAACVCCLLLTSGAAQAGIWDRGAEFAVAKAAAKLGITADEVVRRLTSSPQTQKSILETMEMLGLRDKAPQLFQPNASNLLIHEFGIPAAKPLISPDSGTPLVNHQWDFTKTAIKCGSQGAGVTGLHAAATGQVRPEVGLTFTATCSGIEGLRYGRSFNSAGESVSNLPKFEIAK